jgi:hypothetical protein
MAAISTDALLAEIITGNVARLRRLLPPTGDPADDGASGRPDGITPLMAAAACGHNAAVPLLLQTGADPALRDARGRTAAAYARAAGYPHLPARLDTVVQATEAMR